MLSFKFEPNGNLSPVGEGDMVIHMPVWLELPESTDEYAFDTLDKDTCVSTAFDVTSSSVSSTRMTIKFENM